MIEGTPTFVSAREAARQLGLSVVTIRRAFREGRLTGLRLGEREGWSFLMVHQQSIDAYRANHLGKRGPVVDRCQTCSAKRADHDGADHEYVADGRLKGAK